MQTFLITSCDQKFIKREIENIQKKIKASQYNTFEIIPLPSIGIQETRKIKEILGRKTFMGGDRLIIIREFEKTTLEAGNAMLKILEEPPKNTYFILTASNVNRIIPTIISRCQIISSQTNKADPENQNTVKTKKILLEILSSSPGNRLLISQNIAKTKDQTIRFLDDLVLSLSLMLNHPDPVIKLTLLETALLISKINSAKIYLEKNVNLKATLDILLLGFPVV